MLWCREVAGRRQCRPLSGAAPLAVFEAVEAEALKPLPRKHFVLATWSTGKVGPDIHVKVGKTLYSVPWRHIGRRVDARETPTVVQIFDNGQLIATHGRHPAGKSTDLSHYPPEKIAFKMRTPVWCRTKPPRSARPVRAAQGVLGLAGIDFDARPAKSASGSMAMTRRSTSARSPSFNDCPVRRGSSGACAGHASA